VKTPVLLDDRSMRAECLRIEIAQDLVSTGSDFDGMNRILRTCSKFKGSETFDFRQLPFVEDIAQLESTKTRIREFMYGELKE